MILFIATGVNLKQMLILLGRPAHNIEPS